ncbi:hypothetical protein SO802_020723 [Lithocarpus litseifolius]|uniref:Uncharacterized protein n=1 Tax=Lithocarpus litseifolius TaxID=425828 RepID=A0AAW2CEQ8_9ROSI
MPKQFKPQVTIQEEMNINRRTISEITKIMWDSNSEEGLKIDNSGWYFISCEVCRKKVKSRDEFLWCDNCNKKACFPIPRSKKITQHISERPFEQMFRGARRSRHSCVNRTSKWKQFVFQIQLNDYNLKYGWEFYIVKKVFESFEETDKAIQLDKMTKAYISDTSNECSINLPTEQGGDCTKFQKVDVQSNVQLTPTSVLKENKRTYLGITTKQQGRRYEKHFKVIFQFI